MSVHKIRILILTDMSVFSGNVTPTFSAIKNNSTTLNWTYPFHVDHIVLNVYLTVATSICVCGVFSNVLCFLAICLYPKLRRPGNILVGNFVLVNLSLTGAAYPLSILTVYLRRYPSVYFPPNFCQWIFFYYFCIHSLCWQECVLALNRFVAIVQPFHYATISSREALITTVCLGYAIPFLLNVCAASIGNRPLFTPEPPFGGCLYNPKGYLVLQVVHGAIGVYLPMSVVGLAYSVIFLKVFRNKRVANGLRMRGSYKRQVAIAKMLCAGFFWFCMTYLPQPVLTKFFHQVYVTDPWSYVASRWALFLGAGANAMVYALMNKDYRQGMLHVLRRRCAQIETSGKIGATHIEMDVTSNYRPQ